MKGCAIPNILPYKTLMKFIYSIDIGERKDLEDFAKETKLPSVLGVYRPLKTFVISLAYWFNNEEGVFYVTVGADGAPFGKDDTATAYLVSFANLLQRVASCDDNHLLLGANCHEDHPLMIAYSKHLSSEIEELESEEHTLTNGKQVRFRCEFIPSDMKWACTMCELEIMVAEFKRKFPNKGEGKDRNKVTAYIAANQSRQEYKPPLGKLIDRIKVEPLHTSNNCWQHWFKLAMTVAMQLTEQKHLKSAQKVNELPKETAFSQFLSEVKSTAKCDRLHKKLCNWFSEERIKNIAFSYRFTGKESKLVAKNFAYLMSVLLKQPNISKGLKLRLHALAYVVLQLRDCCALFNSVNISRQQVEELEEKCKHYFTAIVLLFAKQSVSPSVWSLGHAVPFHTRKIFETLGYGLGLNTVQGREAKHVKLAKYMENTTNTKKNQRWWMVFRHEYVSLIWLRQKDPRNITYRKKPSQDSFIPTKVQDQDEGFCYCGLSKIDGQCSICQSEIYTLVLQSVHAQKVDPRVEKLVAL